VPIIWQEYTAAMQREDPEEYTRFQQKLKEGPVDVETLIKALGNRWFVYVPSSGTGEKAGDLQIALCVDLQNPAAFTTVWQQLLTQAPPEQVKTVDFSGVTIYQMGGPSDFDVEERPAFSPSVAILSDRFIFASSLDLGKSIINNSKREVSPLAGETEFQKLLGHTIENPDGILFMDGRVLAPWLQARFEELRPMMQMMLRMAEATPELPPPDALKKYQSTSLLAFKWTDDGLLIKTWEANPKLEP